LVFYNFRAKRICASATAVRRGEERGPRHPGQAQREPGPFRTQAAFCAVPDSPFRDDEGAPARLRDDKDYAGGRHLRAGGLKGHSVAVELPSAYKSRHRGLPISGKNKPMTVEKAKRLAYGLFRRNSRGKKGAFGLGAQEAVKMFVPAGHFYSPVVNPAVAIKHLDAVEAAGPVASVPGVEIDRAAMIGVWRDLLPFLQSNPFSGAKTPGLRYTFENPAYSWGDGSVLHAMLRWRRPRRLIEIGSGWSSACALDTIEKYLDNACEATFIEPYPHLLRKLIGATQSNVQIIEKPVQQVSLSIFEELEEGDIVFIDSTHVLSTGSDVCFELFEILPRLRPGVFVHFHDMFWPFEYPRAWAVDDNRSWNELYAVRALLSDSRAWRVVFFNDYFGKLEGAEINATFPTYLKNYGGALWLRRL
jgi:hypothetical protein